MKRKTIFSLLTLMLCMGIFCVPAFAAEGDVTPDVFKQTSNTFTPDGTGTVVDNATDGDGKEFFTIETEDGNVFYLVIDRQRQNENVYFLHGVSENDLMALAQKSGKSITSGTGSNPSGEESAENPSPPPSTPPQTKTGNDNGLYIFLGIAVIAIGGLGYYFKIVKKKKNTQDEDEVFDEYPDEEEELDLDDEDEDE